MSSAVIMKWAGRWALLLVAMGLLTLASLFVVGGFLVTFPILRMSPRDRRIKSVVDFASSGMTMVTAFSEGSFKKALADAMEPNEPGEEEVEYPYEDGSVLVLGPDCIADNEAGVINWRGVNYHLAAPTEEK